MEKKNSYTFAVGGGDPLMELANSTTLGLVTTSPGGDGITMT
jgi:hypothetical protein